LSFHWRSAFITVKVCKMVDITAIQSLCEQIVRQFNPLKVVLFGSYAYGAPTEDSDVDLLVVMPVKGKAVNKAAEILLSIDHKFPVDVIVRTPELVKKRIALGDFFLKDIMEKGKVLYEAADARMGEKGGRGLRNRVA